jgi:DNA-binding NarL/FixJ family response regulator
VRLGAAEGRRVVSDGLSTLREAWARHDWQAAYDAAVTVQVSGSDRAVEAERLDLFADAAWWLGRLDRCIEARDGAYAIFDELGEHRQAGQCAVWLYEHHCLKCQPAMASGWLRRARRALEHDLDCVEHGALLLREAEVAHGRGELEPAAAVAQRVVDLGRRLGSTDLEAEALQTLGRLLIDQGQPHEGLARLDEAMLFAVEGRLGPYATGKVYCSLVGACEDLGDLGRAAEWTEATSRWAQQHPFAIFPGICRVHRAAALEWRGELAEAEREATQACAELIGLHVPNAAAAFTEVGDLRRRLGDLDGAEAAFTKAEELCGHPSAGMALLRLAQGRIEEATGIISRALDEQPWNRLARARLLPARAQIAVAVGDLAAAAAAVGELQAIAEEFDTAPQHAATHTARARLQLAEHDANAACATARRALTSWLDLDVPYEVATARTILGQALHKAGDDSAAAASFVAAEALFDQLGARLDARQVQNRTDCPTLPAGLTDREAEVLRLVADGRSNKEIATGLHLSTKTVSRHLSNIFTKIDVSSRSAATAFAFEHHLVHTRR